MKTGLRGAEGVLAALVLAVAYVVLVGDLNLRASAIQSGLVMDFGHEIVGAAQPKIAWLQWLAIAAVTGVVVGLLPGRQRGETEGRLFAQNKPLLVFGLVLLAATIAGYGMGLPDFSATKEGIWSGLQMVLQGFATSPAGLVTIAALVLVAMCSRTKTDAAR